MKYVSTKEYIDLGSVAYRQWKADTNCRLIHGYSMSFYFEFEADSLDARNWVVDFAGLRQLKEFLEDHFDHTLLVAEDDPHKDELLKLGELGIAKPVMVEKVGCEALSEFLLEYVNASIPEWFGKAEAERIRCRKVRVQETRRNSAFVEV